MQIEVNVNYRVWGCLVFAVFTRSHQVAALVSTTKSLPLPLSVDEILVKQQLGYLPPNFVSVSARTFDGSTSPVAIQTYPLNGGAPRRQAKATATSTPALLGAPFPTLYWLTCPEISRAVADLERRGYVTKFQEQLNSSPADASQLFSSHEQYAKKRWDSLKEGDRSLLMMNHRSVERMRNILECSGVAGTDYLSQKEQDGSFVPTVKCLHGHYAHFRSTNSDEISNPVGCWIHDQLQVDFPNLIL